MTQRNEQTGTTMTLADQARDLVSTFESRRDTFEKALARRVDPDRFIQIVATAFMQTPKLRECSKLSLYSAAVESAQVGLKPDGEEAAIVPYWNKETESQEAQFQPMYQGLVRLMLRAGAKKVESRVVRSGDEFSFNYGLNPDLTHRPASSDQRGDVTHAYAVVWLPEGATQFEVMDRSELDKVRRSSKSPNSPAWREWTEQMYRKTVLRRLRKYVELDSGASAAFRKDELLEGGEAVPLGELDPKYEVRSIQERAASAARQEVSRLTRAVSDAENGREKDDGSEGGRVPPGDGDASDAAREPTQTPESESGEGASEPGPADPEIMSRLDLDSTVPSGKYRGKTWRHVLRNDREYVRGVIDHRWILDDDLLEALDHHLREWSTAGPETEEDEGEEETDPRKVIPALLGRSEIALKALEESGEEVGIEDRETLTLLAEEEEIDSLRDAVRKLEDRAGLERPDDVE